MKVYFNKHDQYMDWAPISGSKPHKIDLEDALEKCLTPEVRNWEQSDVDRLTVQVELYHTFITGVVAKLAEKGVLTIAEIAEILPKGTISE